MAAEPTPHNEVGQLVVIPCRTFRLQVPWQIAAGHFESLTDEELLEHYRDIAAEINRRTGEPAAAEPGAAG